jgi:hypothetical protein
VAVALARRDDVLLGVGRLGSEVVLDTMMHLGTQAVDLLDSFAAGHPDSLVVASFATEIETALPRNAEEDFGIAEQLGSLVLNNSTAHVGFPLPASEQPALHHFLFVPAHLDQGDVDGA